MYKYKFSGFKKTENLTGILKMLVVFDMWGHNFIHAGKKCEIEFTAEYEPTEKFINKMIAVLEGNIDGEVCLQNVKFISAEEVKA